MDPLASAEGMYVCSALALAVSSVLDSFLVNVSYTASLCYIGSTWLGQASEPALHQEGLLLWILQPRLPPPGGPHR